MILDLARLCFFPALMAFAAASDLLTMTIPNRVSLLLVAGFAILAVAGAMPINEVLQHGAAGLIILTASFACFAMGWIGGGDAKVASAAALWLGLPHLLNYLLYASLFGGALTLLLIQFRHLPLPVMLGRHSWLMRLHGKDEDIPYGIALALGALVIYPETGWIKAVDLAHIALS
ncbi:MAG: prepilin peptidase [Xanthobacteraceae bacterium]|nr:prepilin peptidase [Xanthobacteraceae bacterium]